MYVNIYTYQYIILVCTGPLVDRSLGGDCNDFSHLFPAKMRNSPPNLLFEMEPDVFCLRIYDAQV